jgi:hypothetical protein
MKRWISLVVGLVFFFTIGCAGKQTEGNQTVESVNRLPKEETFINAFSKEIEGDGYTVEKAEEETKEFYPGGNAMLYLVKHPDLGDDYLYIKIEREENEVSAILFSYLFQSQESMKTHIYYELMQAVIRNTDSSIQNNDKAVKQRLEKIIKNSEDSDSYFENGYGYDFYSFPERHQMKFWVFNKSDHEKTEPDSVESVPLHPSKPFRFSKEELLRTLSENTAAYQVKLVETDVEKESHDWLSQVAQSEKPKAEIYAIEHQIGITLGWLLLYETNEGLYHICLVERPAEGEADSGILLNIEEILVQICDPALSVSSESDEVLAAYKIIITAVYKNETEENGVLYQYFFTPNYLTLDVA